MDRHIPVGIFGRNLPIIFIILPLAIIYLLPDNDVFLFTLFRKTLLLSPSDDCSYPGFVELDVITARAGFYLKLTLYITIANIFLSSFNSKKSYVILAAGIFLLGLQVYLAFVLNNFCGYDLKGLFIVSMLSILTFVFQLILWIIGFINSQKN